MREVKSVKSDLPVVVHLIPSLGVGGVEKAILLSLETLNQEIDYRVISLEKPVFKVDGPIGRKVYSAGGFFPLAILRTILMLREMKPRILICSLWKSVPAAAVFKLLNPAIPLVGFFHSTRTFHIADRLFLGVLRRKADFIAVDSEATLNVIAPKAKGKRCYKIPYIFPPKKQLLPDRDASASPRIVFTGRIVPGKNLPAAFKFLQKLHDLGTQATLDIYGSGEAWYIKQLKEDIAGSPLEDHVRFRGFFPPSGTAEILSGYHFLLQLSDAEGMAMSVVDAMLHGVVPIVTPVGEIPSYLKHLDNGIIVSFPLESGILAAAKETAEVCLSDEWFQQMRDRCIHSFDHMPDYCGSLSKMLLGETRAL